MQGLSYPTERYYYVMYLDDDGRPEPRPASDRPEDLRDPDVKSALVAQLGESPQTRDETITVDVKRNVVILTGKVSSALAKRAAGDDAWDTPGVLDVSNQLVVDTTLQANDADGS